MYKPSLTMSGVPLSIIQVGQMYRVESEINDNGATKRCNFNGTFKFTTGNHKFMVFEKTLRNNTTRKITVFVDKLRVFPYNAGRAPGVVEGVVDIDRDSAYETIFSSQDAFTGSASDAQKANMAVVDEIPPPENPAKRVLCVNVMGTDSAYIYLSPEEVADTKNPMYATQADFLDKAKRQQVFEGSRPRSSSDGSATGSDWSDDSAIHTGNNSMPRVAPTPRSAFLSVDEYAGENPMNRKARPSQGGRRSRRGKRRETKRRCPKHRRSRRAKKCCKARRSRRRA